VKASNALCPTLVSGTMRNLARNHRRAQIPFRPVVGRLDSVLAEKPQHMSFVVLGTHPVQQRLIVLVA